MDAEIKGPRGAAVSAQESRRRLNRLAKSLWCAGLAAALAARAETGWVLVDGGMGPGFNLSDFYQDMQYAHQAVTKLGGQVRILAADGTWQVSSSGGFKMPATPLPIDSPATTLDDLMKVIRSLGLKAGDRLVLSFTSHGGRPRQVGHPESATLEFWGHAVSFAELKRALADLPSGVKIKLVSTTCFSGGIHSLAREMPNACSVATTPYTMVGYTGPFAQRFWQAMASPSLDGPNSSLAAAALAGFRADTSNANLGRLSSSDYVDFVLGRGVYGPNDLPDRLHRARDEKGRYSVPQLSPQDFAGTLPADAHLGAPLLSAPVVDADFVERPLTTLIQGDLDRLAESQALAQSLFGEPGETALRGIFERALIDLREHGQQYLLVAQKMEKNYDGLRGQWNAAAQAAAAKKSAASAKELERRRGQLSRAHRLLREETDRSLQVYAFDHQLAERLTALQEFSRRASPEQKKKFRDLVACEWEALP